MDFTLLYCSSMVASSASTACWMICRAPCWISSSSTLFVSDLLPVACSVSIFMVVGAGSRRFAGCAFDKQHSQLNRHRLLKFPLRPLYTRFDNSSQHLPDGLHSYRLRFPSDHGETTSTATTQTSCTQCAAVGLR